MLIFRAIVVAIVLLTFGGWRSGSSSNFAMDAQGWLNFTPRTGSGTCLSTRSGTYTASCKIYAANSGDDTSCAAVVATATPTTGPGGQTCATITKALSMTRDRSEDFVYVNRGDTFTEGLYSTGTQFCLNGKSPYRPLVITTYGTGARPILKVSAAQGYGFRVVACGTGGSNVVVDGLDFYAFDRNPSDPGYTPPVGNTYGFFIVDGISQSLVFQDVRFRFFYGNVIEPSPAGSLISNQPVNFTMRRSQILDQYCEQGIFGISVSGMDLYQNIFDHNGWNTSASPVCNPNALNHNMYLGGVNEDNPAITAVGVRVVENVFSRDGAGNNFRAGGIGLNNLHVQDPIGTNIGAPVATANSYDYNVILEGVDPVPAYQNLGWGISPLSNYSGYAYNVGTISIQNNIIANTVTTSGNGFGISATTGSMGVNNATIANNIICNWQQNLTTYPFVYDGSPISVSNIVGGSGYVDGTYAGVLATGGTGTSARPTIVVSGGTVTSVLLYGVVGSGVTTTLGRDFTVGDTLTVSNTLLGGSGSGFSYKVATIANNNVTTPNVIQPANCSGLGYPAPTPPGGQTLTGNYNASIGGSATTQDYIDRLRAMDRSNWNPLLTAGAHNNYVRQTGFGVATYPYNVGPFR